MSEKEKQLLCYKTIKNNYSIAFALLNIITFIVCFVEIFAYDMWDTMPLYLSSYIVISLFLWAILYLQGKDVWNEKKEFNVKYTNTRKWVYMIVNICADYNIGIGFSNLYFISMTGQNYNIFNYWIIYFIFIIFSVLGITLFSLFNFKYQLNSTDRILKNIGLLIMLFSLLGIICVGLTFPAAYDENYIIIVSALIIFCVHILIGRTFLYLKLLEYSIQKNGVLIDE